ncbi:DUF4384 domain-containing protein [Aerosakkonema sp. BLCC-F183]|uniref:DUF4384 domain-containing protein n=1 Tax=Aerosakkonema sp. BLCC-F183 TaxID=3342834 RepID=UPI0035B8BA79
MTLPTYKEKEQEFLEAMAKCFGFKDKCKLVFLERFRQANDDLENKELAEVLQDNLLEPGEIPSKAEFALRDYLKQIYKKLEAAGCDFNGAKKDKCEIAKAWLRETRYQQWLKEDYFWDKLKAKGKLTNQMGAMLVKVSDLGLRHQEKSPYVKSVPRGSDIKIGINLAREGYLILLEREPSGVVCCLCPSEYAPNSRCAAGVMVLPQYPPSEYATFGSDEVGREQILALITQELPPLDWLEKSKEEALELDREHLYGLLEYVEGNRDCQVLWTEYSVV